VLNQNPQKDKRMGDRSNIAIIQSKSNNDQVWFYGHWAGESNKSAVQSALARNQRWTDTSYLTRIIWDEFCPSEDHGSELGFGISCQIQDNEREIVAVDIPRQIIFEIDEDQLTAGGKVPSNFVPAHHKSWSFEEYAAKAQSPARA